MPPFLGQISADPPLPFLYWTAAGTVGISSTSNSNATGTQQSYTTTTPNIYRGVVANAGCFASGSVQRTPQVTVGLPSNRIVRGSSRRPSVRTVWNFESSVDRPLYLPLPVNNCISVNLPLPPNWNENIERTARTSQPYRLFPIDSKSREFRKLEKLLDPLHVCYIDQIVNPTLWTHFVNERNGMLKAKCNDPTVLKELGLNDEQIEQKQQSINFLRHNAVDAASYDDNFALLFHCTRDLFNVELIQRYGFDERLSKGGTLGRGIYFADSSRKAIQYDSSNIGVLFICAVLLGDCIKDSTGRDGFGLVKQPEKLPAERRYIDDNSFDSVMGQLRHNEYAVYNRYQCYPMYKVVYSKLQSNFGPTSLSDVLSTPPFVWQNEFRKPVDSTWAFHARTVFEEMKEVEAHRQ